MSGLIDQLRARLEATPPRSLNLPGLALRESAVLVPLFIRGEVPYLLFTKRPTTLRRHAGQISFPGGMRDPEDLTPLHTALRETREELGIHPERIEVLGRLDELPTITEIRIIPFVGVIPPDLTYVPSAEEIEEIIEVPFAHFLDAAFQRTERRMFRSEEHEIYFYDYQAHVIWGATAQIVRNLVQVVGDLPAVQAMRNR